MLYVNSINPSNYLLSVAESSYTLNRDDRCVCVYVCMDGCARVCECHFGRCDGAGAPITVC